MVVECFMWSHVLSWAMVNLIRQKTFCSLGRHGKCVAVVWSNCPLRAKGWRKKSALLEIMAFFYFNILTRFNWKFYRMLPSIHRHWVKTGWPLDKSPDQYVANTAQSLSMGWPCFWSKTRESTALWTLPHIRWPLMTVRVFSEKRLWWNLHRWIVWCVELMLLKPRNSTCMS